MHVSVREVVADDVDAVDDRRRPLVDLPAQIRPSRTESVPSCVARRPGECSRRCSLRSSYASCSFCSSRRPTRLRRTCSADSCRRGRSARSPSARPSFALFGRTDRNARSPRSRSAWFAVHLEVADLVVRAFVTVSRSSAFPVLAIDDQRVLHDLHVDVAVRRVQLRNRLAEIVRVLVVVELAVAPPEEPSGFVSIAPTMSSSDSALVAVDLDAGDREAASFVDVKVERRSPSPYVIVSTCTLREVVALRSDRASRCARRRLRDLRRIDRLADQQVDAVLAPTFGETRSGADRPSRRSRTGRSRRRRSRMRLAVDRRRTADDLHVVELVRRVERLDRALDDRATLSVRLGASPTSTRTVALVDARVAAKRDAVRRRARARARVSWACNGSRAGCHERQHERTADCRIARNIHEEWPEVPPDSGR